MQIFPEFKDQFSVDHLQLGLSVVQIDNDNVQETLLRCFIQLFFDLLHLLVNFLLLVDFVDV